MNVVVRRPQVQVRLDGTLVVDYREAGSLASRVRSSSPTGLGTAVEICARVYRPRRARESPLFRLVEQHLEEFLRVYPELFAKVHGPLHPVVERVLRGFLECGDVTRGFARA